MKTLSVALASCLLVASMPPEARADGERGTRRETQSYAGREAQAPMLADFRGGCMTKEMERLLLAMAPIILALLPVGLLVWGATSLYAGCVRCARKHRRTEKETGFRERRSPAGYGEAGAATSMIVSPERSRALA
jgi:hypothetical protein